MRQMPHNKSSWAGHSYRIPVMNVVFLIKAHKVLSNIGAPHLFVDIIPMNNTWYHDKESTNNIQFNPEMVSEHLLHKGHTFGSAER